MEEKWANKIELVHSFCIVSKLCGSRVSVFPSKNVVRKFKPLNPMTCSFSSLLARLYICCWSENPERYSASWQVPVACNWLHRAFTLPWTGWSQYSLYKQGDQRLLHPQQIQHHFQVRCWITLSMNHSTLYLFCFFVCLFVCFCVCESHMLSSSAGILLIDKLVRVFLAVIPSPVGR